MVRSLFSACHYFSTVPQSSIHFVGVRVIEQMMLDGIAASPEEDVSVAAEMFAGDEIDQPENVGQKRRKTNMRWD